MLAIAGVAVMAAPAQAADYTITIHNSAAGYTYQAYQVFAGGLTSDSGDDILTDITWGDGVNGETLLPALQADDTIGSYFVDCNTAAQAAQALEGFGDDSENLDAFAKLVGKNLGTPAGTSSYETGGGPAKYTISGLDSGYYLIQSTQVPEMGTHTKYMLQIVKSIEVTPKATDVPTVEKKVYEAEKYSQDGGYGQGYNDVADYDIGDTVSFKLIGSVPDMSAYDSYAYAFHDTMSAGLALDEESIQVYLTTAKNQELDAPLDAGSYSVSTQSLDDGCTFELSFSDLKQVAGIGEASYVVVTFDATLTSDAVIGLDGNSNEAYLSFSNNPYAEETGKTPKDAAVVFTYALDATKVDADQAQTKLEGAEFVLFNEAKTHVAKVEASTGTLQGWVALTEIAPGANESTITYEQLAGYSAGLDSAIILRSAQTTGQFSVSGLDDSAYSLREIKAPAAYNLLTQDVAVTLTATTANGQAWDDLVAANALTKLQVQVGDSPAAEGNISDGTVSITVENKKGTPLPETGGMGTTLFYAAGGTLAAVAGGLLIVHKRRSAKGR